MAGHRSNIGHSEGGMQYAGGQATTEVALWHGQRKVEQWGQVCIWVEATDGGSNALSTPVTWCALAVYVHLTWFRPCVHVSVFHVVE